MADVAAESKTEMEAEVMVEGNVIVEILYGWLMY